MNVYVCNVRASVSVYVCVCVFKAELLSIIRRKAFFCYYDFRLFIECIGTKKKWQIHAAHLD